jgi:hypothetical protein
MLAGCAGVAHSTIMHSKLCQQMLGCCSCCGNIGWNMSTCGLHAVKPMPACQPVEQIPGTWLGGIWCM